MTEILLENNGFERIAPTVSVVIPIYNREAMIGHALESIVQQTYASWEIVIVDDGSDDDPLSVIKQFASKICQNIYYLRQTNGGAASARNRGIKVSNSQYIAFLDSDDRWLPNHLEIMVGIMSRNEDIDWLCSDLRQRELASNEIVEESKFRSEKNYRFLKSIKSDQRENCYVFLDKTKLTRYLIKYGIFGHVNCSVIKKNVFKSIDFSNFRIGEDRYLAILASIENFKLAITENVTAEFFIHEKHTSVGKNKDVQKSENVYNELIRMYRFLLKNDKIAARDKNQIKVIVRDIIFWDFAYNVLWQQKIRQKSLKFQINAIFYWIPSARMLKTFSFCCAKYILNL